MFASLFLSSGSIPQVDVGEDFHNAAKTKALHISLRPDPVAPSKPGLTDPRAPYELGEARTHPWRSIILPAEEQLASAIQLLLHDSNQDSNCLLGPLGITIAIDD